MTTTVAAGRGAVAAFGRRLHTRMFGVSDDLPYKPDRTDTGCRFAADCTACPYPVCLYEDLTYEQRAALAKAAAVRLYRLQRARGVPARQAARTLRVSRHTLYRTVTELRRTAPQLPAELAPLLTIDVPRATAAAYARMEVSP